MSSEVAGRRRINPRMKQDILERDDYTCQICGISKQFLDDLCPGLGDYLLLEIDHIESDKKIDVLCRYGKISIVVLLILF